MKKYDNSVRLGSVTERDWRLALDELAAYLTWRLRGKTARGAHSERELGMPAFDYYQEEAVVKLIKCQWRWQPRYTLGQQLVEIASNLITKQYEKYKREHPASNENDGSTRSPQENENGFAARKPEMIQFTDNMEQYEEVADEDEQEQLDETYEMVFRLVADDQELTLYVKAIQACGHFDELPAYMGLSKERVYRLQEKLMRRIRKLRVKN